MEFNFDKHVMLHFGRSNQHRTCTINHRALESDADQRDLDIWAHGFRKLVREVDMVKVVFGTLDFIEKCVKHIICGFIM